MDEQRQPWEGDRPCPGDHGKAVKREIEGLGYCIHHVPAEDLAEAEHITGLRRCRRCTYLATTSSNPPLCPVHVRESLTGSDKRAGMGFIEWEVTELVGRIMTEHGDKLINPVPLGDPLDELLALAAEISAFRKILRDRIAQLEMHEWRYAHHRAGEQIRTEIVLYERALDRDAKILVSIAKLRIREHKLELDRELVAVIQRALGMALEASGLDLVGQQKAREILGRELAGIEK
jgi:hypothetical protein